MWLVCQNKSGYLFLQTRKEREDELGICLISQTVISTFVVAKFRKKKDAEKYIDNIEFAKRLINHCFK